ncbi:MAG: endonuclease domain-containing protein [Candidatus Dormibacteria bacterium]
MDKNPCNDCRVPFVESDLIKSKDGLNRCISCTDYAAMLKSQGGACAICKRPEVLLNRRGTQSKRLAIDHDHVIGKVRGLLCHNCNTTLGMLDENPNTLLDAHLYLQKYGKVDWDHYHINIAKMVSTKSKDPSTKVGAVITRPDHTIAGTGFNGFPRGMEDKPEWLENRVEKYPRMIHAELNALLSCTDQHLKGYDCYGSFMPCDKCFVHLVNVGIKAFYFPKPTIDELTRWGEIFGRTQQYANDMKIPLIELST